jgi:hypothetical protein
MGGPRTEESRELARARANAYWADPAVRKAHGEKTRLRMDRPEVRAKIVAGTKAAMADPDVRSRQRDGLRRAFADPALRQKVSQRTKAGIAAKLDRHFADLIKVWSETPDEVRRRFIDYARASWGADEEASTIRSSAETLVARASSAPGELRER